MMLLKSILAVLAGLLVWMVVATILNFGLRAALPGYHQAEPAMMFTLGMKIGRLIVGALASLAAGATAGMIALHRAWPGWVLGVIILAFFIPAHIHLWAKFPVWYHLTFLGSVVPLVVVGAGWTRAQGGNGERKVSKVSA